MLCDVDPAATPSHGIHTTIVVCQHVWQNHGMTNSLAITLRPNMSAPCDDDAVAVWFNIPKSKSAGHAVWSIGHTTSTGGRGPLIGHVDGTAGVVITDAVPVESAKRQQVVKATQTREVCGWIVGRFSSVAPADVAADMVVRYSPKQRSAFYVDGGDYTGSPVAVFTDRMRVSGQ